MIIRKGLIKFNLINPLLSQTQKQLAPALFVRQMCISQLLDGIWNWCKKEDNCVVHALQERDEKPFADCCFNG